MDHYRIENEGSGQVRLQRCAFLDCTSNENARRRNATELQLVLARRGGEIESIRLSAADGHRLLAQLAYCLRPDKRPPQVRYGTSSWLRRKSILRAEAAVQGTEGLRRAERRHRMDLPDVVCFVDEQLVILKRLLAQCNGRVIRKDTVLRRVRRTLTTVIEALRHDK